MGQFIAEYLSRFRGSEVTALFTPPHDRFAYTRNQLPYRVFALYRVRLAVKIF